MKQMFSSEANEYEGDSKSDEIEIISDEQSLSEIRSNLPGGYTSEIGAVYQDEYIIVMRDPVCFPNGKLGTYLRIIERPALDGTSGAVIVPFFNNKLILRKIFRHATRSWEIEFPRGYRKADELPVDCAKRELAEELGVEIDSFVHLGCFNSNSGILSGKVDAFFAYLKDAKTNPSPEDEEVLSDIVMLSYEEILEEIKNGNIKDGISMSALLLAGANKVLP